MDEVVVLGGAGFLGRHFCAHWVERTNAGGTRLIVATRHAMHGRDLLELPTVEVEEANVHDDEALARLVAGRDAVVNLIGVLQGSRADFERAHVELPRRLARACKAAGVRRVVHVSALGVADDAPSAYLRTKAAGESVLRAAGLDLTLMRPSVMFGKGDRLLTLFARLQSALPVVPLAGARSRYQPVWVEDVAVGIVRCLEDAATFGQTYECVGPEVYTLQELVRAAGRWSGRRRPVVPLPDPLARVQAMVMEALPGTPLLSRDNLASMQVDSVATGRFPTLRDLGIEPSSMAAVAPQYLAHGMGLADWLNSWRARRSP